MTPPWLDPKRMLGGGDFFFDETADQEPIWGLGDEILWHTGEGCMLCGPTGAGKTTVTGQLLLALIGLRTKFVLGFPVARVDRVLYLAGDRPDQFRRAMLRLVRPEERDLLNERLIIWRGPSPKDLGQNPEILLEMAMEAEADVVIVDSLKDAALKLSDDQTGSGVHRAVQLCLVEGVQVLLLHHQRKGQEGRKPNTIEDVYGSTWIVNGMGSVILLWGNPGSPLVELIHLKQPADTVGPFMVEHDHLEGTSRVIRGGVTALSLVKPSGSTVVSVAGSVYGTEEPSDAQRKQVYRKLEALVKSGQVRKMEAILGGAVDGHKGSAPARYFPVAESLDKALPVDIFVSRETSLDVTDGTRLK